MTMISAQGYQQIVVHGASRSPACWAKPSAARSGRSPSLAARAALRTTTATVVSAVEAVRDYDGKYGSVVPNAAEPTRTPTMEETMADLYPEERQTVQMFQSYQSSVVNISTSTTVLRPFSFDVMQIPRGQGSGFVWDLKGHVITNSHVVESASQVSITISDGTGTTTTAKATVVGRDKERDVAILKMDLPADKLAALTPLKLGSSSNLLVGQKVYALGNPFGLDLSLTQGIVSGLGRDIGSRRTPITNIIQTDAAINPGNSGGPLLDSKGRLVGINTAILDPSGVGSFSGVGFAIPVDSVRGIVEQILTHGRVIRPAMGISISPPPMTKKGKQDGVLVVNVRPGGPADVAGIQPTRREMFGKVCLGDIIVEINGKAIKKQLDLFAALDRAQVGQAVEVTLAPRPDSRWAATSPNNGASTTAKGRTVRVVLADREKMQWGSE